MSLDDEAADQILDLDSQAGLPLIDLNQAGWRITPPTRGEDGITTIGVTKSFGTPDQFAEVMAELTGDNGLVADFELIRTKSFATVDYEVRGELAPGGLESFADADLTAALGRTAESLAERYGGSSADVDVALRVRLPGNPDDGVAVTGAESTADGTERVWQTNLASDTAAPVLIASTSRAVAALVWRGIAVLAGVLAGLVLFGQVLRLFRPERRRKNSVSGARPRPSAKGPAKVGPKVPEVPLDLDDGGDPEDDQPRVVALDGMGVLYREGSDINEILLPFAREMGSEVTNDEIISRARALSLGRMTPADFWSAIGIHGDVNELDEAYLSRHQLSPGVVKFLRDLRKRNVRVACITNDSTVWANKLRARHSLTGLVDPWVISGAVGIRKPDAPIYEVLRRVTGEAPKHILVVDDQLDNLDAARDLGFQTAWFAPDGDAAGSRDHAILRSFAVAAPETATT